MVTVLNRVRDPEVYTRAPRNAGFDPQGILPEASPIGTDPDPIVSVPVTVDNGNDEKCQEVDPSEKSTADDPVPVRYDDRPSTVAPMDTGNDPIFLAAMEHPDATELAAGRVKEDALDTFIRMVYPQSVFVAV